MKYMGSKNRIAKYILPIILKNRRVGKYYVEPFVGGCNMIDKVEGNRIGNDSNYYLVDMWKALVAGWIPREITADQYKELREKEGPSFLIGWAGIACSYSGKWFGGFAGKTQTKQGVRDYQAEAIKNASNQVLKLKGVQFMSMDYKQLNIPENSIIYCDPPYEGTTGYKDEFNHTEFWEWCREKARQGHEVFVSEYKAPEDFVCLWELEVKSSLSANGKIGGSKISTEKLFTYNGVER